MITNASYANADATLIIADTDEVVRRILSEADTPELWLEALVGEVAPFVPLPIHSDDQGWTDLRAERDRLLTQSDWVVTRSIEMGEAVPAAWATYRQALRDLPEVIIDPAQVEWPTAPT